MELLYLRVAAAGRDERCSALLCSAIILNVGISRTYASYRRISFLMYVNAYSSWLHEQRVHRSIMPSDLEY